MVEGLREHRAVCSAGLTAKQLRTLGERTSFGMEVHTATCARCRSVAFCSYNSIAFSI